jgi:hypothetical protein
LRGSERRVRIEVILKRHESIQIGFFGLKDLDDVSFSKPQGSFFQCKLLAFRDISRERLINDFGFAGIAA